MVSKKLFDPKKTLKQIDVTNLDAFGIKSSDSDSIFSSVNGTSKEFKLRKSSKKSKEFDF